MALKAAVLEHGADIGLAFDGDADRVFLVDERAEPVSGSLTTALVAVAMLDKHPGATVLYNLICSHVVPEVIAEHGGVGVRTRVGHSFIKEVMAETGAVFGGEHSGHYYYQDNFRADSGIITALLVLEMLSGHRPPALRTPPPVPAVTPTRARSTPRSPIRRPPSRRWPEARGGGRPVGRPAGRPHGGPRGLVVQPATLEHRAPLAAQRRGGDRGGRAEQRVHEVVEDGQGDRPELSA